VPPRLVRPPTQPTAALVGSATAIAGSGGDVRLLVVGPRFPWPLDKGDQLTVFNMVKHFSRQHQVALVTFAEPNLPPDVMRRVADHAERVKVVPHRRAAAYAGALRALFTGGVLQVGYHSSRRMARAVAKMVADFRPDVVYAHTIRMAPYLAALPNPKVLGMQISMALNYGRLAGFARSPLWRLLYRLEAARARRYEPRITAEFDRCLLISEADAGALGPQRPVNVVINPHGVDFDHFTSDGSVAEEPGRIVFTGNMAYPPNVDAVEWFVEEMLPRVQKRVPGASLWVAGADPSRRVRALGRHPGVEVTGRVPDLRPHMDRAQVGIDPLRVGAGLQNKVLEGMSMALPMVITSVANEGIGAVPGQHVVMADDAGTFAEEVACLLEDPARGSRIGAEARRFIVDGWSWEKHFADLERQLELLVKRGG